MRPPQDWRRARVTAGLCIAVVVAFVLAQFTSPVEVALRGGFIPARMGLPVDATVVPDWLTPLSSAFIHAGILHILFNLLIFAFCGRSVENVLGPAAIGILFVVGAYAAALGHYLLDPGSMYPMIGASGAVSAIVGAYAMLFGRNRVKVENPTLALWLNALWLAVGWIALQALLGFASGMDGNVAIAIGAHIGGFLVGIALARPLLLFRYRGA
jgi:membrane associated rhomboid family serine protease